MAKKTQAGTSSDSEHAKNLYADGDYKGARALAKTVLASPDAGDAARRDAQAIVDSTRIARPSLVAGFVMLAVVVALFLWALARPHVH